MDGRGRTVAEVKAAVRAGPEVPPIMTRLMSEESIPVPIDQRRFLRSSMAGVPVETAGEPNVREVYQRFDGDVVEVEGVRDAKRAQRKAKGRVKPHFEMDSWEARYRAVLKTRPASKP